ncbi:MAG: hypothetical protein AUG83_06755 [Acidobacteria bacterium 13_1_20CM_4_57_11]|nr:MAG: hypothetical protein AUG83_06755 [Acidobacteria bacterium 13_1_20CM_4_57_11]
MSGITGADIEDVRMAVSAAALNPKLVTVRKDLALFASSFFSEVGTQLHAAGNIFGTDRKNGKSPFQHGSDEVVGMSVLLRIGGQLISASAELLTEGRPYAGAALLRQIVEIEYLAWAFESRHQDAERWLRSDREIREEFFKPAKLRTASRGKFRGKDYSFHCELGGHPVPTGTILLKGDPSTVQLLLSDLLGHTGNVWDYFVGWAKRHEDYTAHIKNHALTMAEKFQNWKSCDPLVELPPP